MKACGNILQLARDLDLEPKLLYTWKNQFEGRPEPRHANYMETPAETLDNKLRQEIAQLKQALAERHATADTTSPHARRGAVCWPHAAQPALQRRSPCDP